jgi:Nif11 domain
LFDTDLERLTQAQNLERFRELVLADSVLHDQLRAAASEAAFIELAIRLAAERGCELTASALQTAINQKRRAWLERWL